VRFTAALARSRIYALFQAVVNPDPVLVDNRFELSAEVDSILDHTIGPSSYHRDDVHREQVLHHFEINLKRMVAIAERSGAKIVFITPQSNLKDFSPFKSETTLEPESENQQQWARLYSKANRLASDGDYEGAVAAFDNALKLDDRFAELHFQYGSLLFEMGRSAEAAAAFARAVEEDVCPLRAPSAVAKQMRRVAKLSSVPLVDFEAYLCYQCVRAHGHNCPGNEYFLDHVHPNIATHGLIAKLVVDKLIQERIVTGGDSWNNETFDRISKRIESEIIAEDHAKALLNLAKVLNWAGKHYEAGPLALRALESLPNDPECLLFSALYLYATGDEKQAIPLYLKAIENKPDYTKAQTGLGTAYASAHFRVGLALYSNGDLKSASRHYRETIALDPNFAEGHCNLGHALKGQGRFAEALLHMKKGHELGSRQVSWRYPSAQWVSEIQRLAELEEGRRDRDTLP
jgi:tetratricopeptide (TPR) repeat protein